MVVRRGNNADNTLFGTNAIDYLYGEGGNDTLFGGLGDDWLYGGAGNDTLNGEAGADKLYGGAGNDTLNAEVGNDRLFGEAGNDTLNASAGNDVLNGGDGNDRLFGVAGNDSLTGGRGADQFNFQVFANSEPSRDIITDFQWAQNDKIRLGFSGSWEDLDTNGTGELDNGDAFVTARNNNNTLIIDVGGAFGFGANEQVLTVNNLNQYGLIQSDFVFA